MQNCNTAQLPDLREVLSSMAGTRYKSQEEKVEDFLLRIKNPYEYRVGQVVVRTRFAGSTSMDDCFASFLAMM